LLFFCVCGEDFGLTNSQGFVLCVLLECLFSQRGMRIYIICRFRMKYVMDVCHLLLPCSCARSRRASACFSLLSLSSTWYMAEKETKKRKSQKTPSCLMQSLLDKTSVLLHLSPSLPLHMPFMLVSFVAYCHHHPSISTLLIIGITATTSTSREPVLDPPDEETEKS
jgi:hypothetical protein